MHILISPNAFKNSINAADAARAIEKGLQESKLICTTHCLPVGDGGDGTGQLLTQICKGVNVSEEVHDPLGRKIYAEFGLIDNAQTAVIEMAAASGLRLLNTSELDPLHASSYGTGELMIRAIDRGAKKIILCVGGSATVDGGCGIAEALGIRFMSADLKIFRPIPEKLIDLSVIDMSKLDKRIPTIELIILADVNNPLLGENGAACIFGPQKGASSKEVMQLEASLIKFSEVIFETVGIDITKFKHGGAAGGTAAGLKALLNAKPVNGIDHFLEMICFNDALNQADLVITGEGSIDLQTLEGKGPFGVALRAKEKNIPVVGFAGKLPEKPSEALAVYFDRLININQHETDLTTALLSANGNLEQAACELGNLLSIS